MTLFEMLNHQKLPICVDLDGTLILRNSFWSLLRLFFSHGGTLKELLFPLSWTLMKKKVAQRARLSGKSLFFYRDSLVQLLGKLSHNQAKLFLVTGAHQTVADFVGQQIHFFQDVVGSTEHHNLVGEHKAHYLNQRFGPHGFNYIGDSWKDLAVWRFSSHIFVVPEKIVLRYFLHMWKKPHQKIFVIAKTP